MLLVVFLALPLQLFGAAAPASNVEWAKKCEAMWKDLMPLAFTPVFTSLEEQEPVIVKALTTHGILQHEQIVSLIRTNLSKAWWHFKGYKKLSKPWVQPQRLKPQSPAHSVLLRNLLLKYGSHHES